MRNRTTLLLISIMIVAILLVGAMNASPTQAPITATPVISVTITEAAPSARIAPEPIPNPPTPSLADTPPAPFN